MTFVTRQRLEMCVRGWPIKSAAVKEVGLQFVRGCNFVGSKSLRYLCTSKVKMGLRLKET